MALLLTARDLEPLFATPASVDSLLEMVAEASCAQSRGEVTGAGGFLLPLPDKKRNFRIMTAALPNAGALLRVYALFAGAKDGHFNILFDAESGDLLALIAGAELNVWRTGAPAGVACRLLARHDAQTLALLGSGRQARGQLLAIRRAVPSLKLARVFSPTEAHRRRFAEQMTSWLGLDVEAAEDPRAALARADIIAVATNSRAPVLDEGWIEPGALIISITSGQLPAALVARSRVVVSSREELLSFKPPRQPYSAMIARGAWSADKAAELGEVMLGQRLGRQGESEIVLFELLGLPAWDAAASAWAYRWALDHKAGAPFSLG
ncbi:MAG TPA: hypothetical protein VNL14_07005 [Candidatus Acidoferrales bacterium]|nr:hypothetical protein [Candidatus Acidoferrales bacterium]